jgi:quercetin dioxygenase-like cupin family protein
MLKSAHAALVAITLLAAVVIAPVVITPALHAGSPKSSDATNAAAAGPVLETLMKAALEGVDGTEVIISRVTLPPHTTLPKHWHPGEEFAYILDGTVTLWQLGKEDTVGRPGDTLKVPLKQVHTAMTGEQGATILVFRVHEQGKPERVPAD